MARRNSSEIRAFYKRHKEITGVDADHWGSIRGYMTLQALTQAIEAVGAMDREAIADYVRKNKFTTIDGEIWLPGQILNKAYTVGQWQNGFFHGVNGVGRTDFLPVKLKASWS